MRYLAHKFQFGALWCCKVATEDLTKLITEAIRFSGIMQRSSCIYGVVRKTKYEENRDKRRTTRMHFYRANRRYFTASPSKKPCKKKHIFQHMHSTVLGQKKSNDTCSALWEHFFMSIRDIRKWRGESKLCYRLLKNKFLLLNIME